MQNFTAILHRFGLATSLRANIEKTQVVAIRCENVDLDEVLQNTPATRASLPMKYLGLPLTTGKLRKADLQPLFDKSAGKMAVWRGRNLGLAGRTTLVKLVLSSQPVYLLTALKVSKESMETLDKQRKSFLWAGSEKLTGGKCKVNWKRTCSPTVYGGLGILNLENFARALRIRWLWQEWKAPERTWIGRDNPCDNTEKTLFAAATTITVGDGETASFWNSAWMQGRRPRDVMPLVYAISKRKNRSLKEGVTDNVWVQDLNFSSPDAITVELLDQIVTLWSIIQSVQLSPDVTDEITWKFTNHGEYTTSCAYKMQFLGSINANYDAII